MPEVTQQYSEVQPTLESSVPFMLHRTSPILRTEPGAQLQEPQNHPPKPSPLETGLSVGLDLDVTASSTGKTLGWASKLGIKTRS